MAEREPEEIREEIEQTREEMGETVEELAGKADVKAQAQERVEDVKARARAKIEDLKATVREKRDQVMSGASGGSTAGPGIAPQAPPVGEEGGARSFDPAQVLAAAKENPVPLAVGALVAGIVIGRLTSR